ncbi:MAG TPA: ABC transporter substrate-binding protein, partial [Thermoanaerobaculia bacterium]|nr:ABC transporter substrate-binding protein [Thermoanaerobaculia bacterium]
MPAKNSGRPARLLASARLAAALTALALLALGGCGGKGPGGSGKAAQTPHRGGTVVIGETADIRGVNELILSSSAFTSEVLYRLFLHLVEEQPDFVHHPPTFAPQLAHAYEWSPDHKLLTFHLRENALWSDGVPVTADDVRWTWQAQVNPAVAWDSSFMKDAVQDVEVVDPHTVRFHFSRVYAKQMEDVNEGMILPKHAWEKLPFGQWRKNGSWFAQHLVVDGPFDLESRQPDQQIVLKRNPRYFEEGLPYLDRVVIRVIPDQSSLMTQLWNGDVDFVPQISPADAKRVQADPKLQLLAFWYRLTVGVAWNNARSPFSDPEVRRALTLAIDRQTIVDTLLGAYGRVATSPIITDVWAHDRSLRPWPYDPAKARQILAARGFRDSDGDGVLDRGGKPLTFELLSNAGNQLRIDAAVMIQDQLKKVGIRVQPRVVEFNTLVTQTNSGQYDAAIMGLTMDTSLDLTAWFHSRSIKEGNNFVRYANPEVDRLIEQAMAEKNIADARPALDRIQQILDHDQPYTLLWESQRLNAVNRRVHDV